eukprot:1180925-Prorocentrum_minimum.AAC.3
MFDGLSSPNRRGSGRPPAPLPRSSHVDTHPGPTSQSAVWDVLAREGYPSTRRNYGKGVGGHPLPPRFGDDRLSSFSAVPPAPPIWQHVDYFRLEKGDCRSVPNRLCFHAPKQLHSDVKLIPSKLGLDGPAGKTHHGAYHGLS